MHKQPGSETRLNVAITGGGAAGFFAAIHIKDNYPGSSVTIFEKASQVLSKVRISGGGRCNLTNNTTDLSQLIKAYPRGTRLMRDLVPFFGPQNTMQWFENKGVPLVTQEDGCVFPRSQDSSSIVDTLIREALKRGVIIYTNTKIQKTEKTSGGNLLLLHDNPSAPTIFDKVIVTTGGSSRQDHFQWLKESGHKIEQPVPSLFPFKIENTSLRKLTGTVVPNVITSIPETKFTSSGALLITHEGMSGPAILRLSSFAARNISEKNFRFNLNINWIAEKNHDKIRESLLEASKHNDTKQINTLNPFNINRRLWEYILYSFDPDLFPGEVQGNIKRWGEAGKKRINKLTNKLASDSYKVTGRSASREEFVTCGGVSLDSIHRKTLESKSLPGLYFAGEILDIDALTGGYNLQAAWTTGFIAAMLK